MGEKSIAENGKDTLYHTVPDFSFINQYHDTVKSQNFAGKTWIVEYFFSNCTGICVQMNQQMNRVYQTYLEDSNIVLLSFTVDPERDSVTQLQSYASAFNIEKNKWHFLTGQKDDLYRLATKGFLISAEEAKDSLPDFIHDEHFVLVDKDRHIRGFYKGTDAKEVDRLIDEIKVLKMEDFVSKKEKK